MSVTVTERKQLLAELLADLLGLEPEMATSLDTVEGARLAGLVEALYGIMYQMRQVERDAFLTALISTAALEKHANARLGPDARKAATKSSGVDVLRVTGAAPGAAVAAGDTLVHTDGTRYQLTEGATIDVGTADLSLESISKGTQCNKLTGDTLSFESPPAGIETQATLVGDLEDAKDAETDAELLVRVLHAYRNPPAGGRFSDYWAWALTIADIVSAYVYGPSPAAPTGRRGMGVTDVAVLKSGSGANRIPTPSDVQAAQDKIDAGRPSTTKDSLVLTPAADAQGVDVKLTPYADYEADWTGSGTVSSWDAGNKRITWGATLSASLKAAVDAGDQPRIFLNGEVLTVTAYAEPAHTTDLLVAPTVTPASPDPIYAGGPLSAPVLQAIKDYFDTLGTARGTAADPNQNWDDVLRVAKLYASVVYRLQPDNTTSGVTGTKDADVVTPASNVTPTDHAPSGTVDLIVYAASNHPDCITVRYA